MSQQKKGRRLRRTDCVERSAVGAHLFLWVKCLNCEPLMIGSTRTTPQPLSTKMSANDFLRFSSQMSIQAFSPKSLLLIRVYETQTDLSATRLLLTCPRELSSMDVLHTTVR